MIQPSSNARTVAIVGGCGHVGLPLGISLADAGWHVALVDTSDDRVRMVSRGEMPFLEEGAQPLLARVLASGHLRATTDLEAIAGHEVVIVTIGTPVDEFLDPMVRSFDRFMRDRWSTCTGQLIVLRSTLFPGVTERLGRTICRREGRGIDIAYCPERIAQGYAMHELRKLPQLISGTSPARGRAGARVLRDDPCDEVIEMTPVEAELAKLFSNAYRYINFAISNQFYMIAKRFGADFQRIITRVTHDYPRMKAFARRRIRRRAVPAQGHDAAGGVQPLDLPARSGGDDDQRGACPASSSDSSSCTRKLSRMTVGILGMAFKGDNDDPRSSLSYKLRKVLLLEAKAVLCTDPYIHEPGLPARSTRWSPVGRADRRRDARGVQAAEDRQADHRRLRHSSEADARMKVLVTGSAGFIGGYLVEELLAGRARGRRPRQLLEVRRGRARDPLDSPHYKPDQGRRQGHAA